MAAPDPTDGAAVSSDPGESGDVTTPDSVEPQDGRGGNPPQVSDPVGEERKDTNPSGLVP